MSQDWVEEKGNGDKMGNVLLICHQHDVVSMLLSQVGELWTAGVLRTLEDLTNTSWSVSRTELIKIMKKSFEIMCLWSIVSETWPNTADLNEWLSLVTKLIEIDNFESDRHHTVTGII